MHGYKQGHQLLAATIKLPRADQDLVDRLSDLSGPLQPGQFFHPYLTAYPLPSGSAFVLARTWQDRDAARSGCVLTRSLIVPMQVWVEDPAPWRLADLLSLPDRTAGEQPALRGGSTTEFLNPVADPCLIELVEALFLEARKPIVAFDLQIPDVLGLRLLTSLWPSLRQTFSICTYALSARALLDRPFDLLFAPSSARSRFADWPGRRIPSSTSHAVARHSWSMPLAELIFQSPDPRLALMDSIGALKSSNSGDASGLRLSLLWNDLLTQSATSPLAVLGMMDILNSRPDYAPAAVDEVEKLAERSIKNAVATLPSSDLLVLLYGILNKFSRRRPSRSLIRALRTAAIAVAHKDPWLAAEFLTDQSRAGKSVEVLIAAISDGVAANENSADFAHEVMHLDIVTLQTLIAYGASFSFAVMRAAIQHEHLAAQIARAITVPNFERRKRARRHLQNTVTSPAHAPVLQAILSDANYEEFVRIVAGTGKNTGFEHAALDAPLVRAAFDDARIAVLRDAATKAPDGNRLLLSTLRPDSEDVDWLCSNENLQPSRKTHLLAGLLDRADDRQLHQALREHHLADAALGLLTETGYQFAVQQARILTLARPSLRMMVECTGRVIGSLSANDAHRLAEVALARMLRESDGMLTKRALDAIHSLVELADARWLVIHAAAPDLPAKRLNENLSLLRYRLTDPRMLGCVGELSKLLVQRRASDISISSIEAWASMINQSGHAEPRAQLRAAEMTLPYAFDNLFAPLSPLVVASFPVIYRSLSADNASSGSMLNIFFPDWDRCKVVRQHLVEAFGKSKWPPADIVVASLGAGDTQRILRRVRRQLGSDYIRKIAKDAERLPPSLADRVLRELEEARRWDE